MEVALRMVGGPDVRIEEEVTCVFVGPVRWDGVSLFRIGLDVRDNAFEIAVVANKFQSGVWADFGNRIKVVATEKYA